MKTFLQLCSVALTLAVGVVRADTPAAAEVPLSLAKALALSLAQGQLPSPVLASVRLYRNLDDQPAVWVLEYRSDASDTPLTVVAAATRDLPPLVMHWRGSPWHADPEYLAAARASLEQYQRADAKADW